MAERFVDIQPEQPPFRPPQQPEGVTPEKSVHEHNFEHWLERYARAKSKEGTNQDNENYAIERKQGFSSLVYEFVTARRDSVYRSVEQYQRMCHRISQSLSQPEAKRLIAKATYTDLTLQSLSDLGYVAELTSPKQAEQDAADIFVDLQAPTQQEWDALPYRGVLLHLDTGYPVVEIPNNQLVFAQPDGPFRQLLTEDNVYLAGVSDKFQDTPENTVKKSDLIEQARKHHAHIWDRLHHVVDTMNEGLSPGDRPFAAAIICYPDAEETRHLYDPNTGEFDAYTDQHDQAKRYYLTECLQQSLDSDEGMAYNPSRLDSLLQPAA